MKFTKEELLIINEVFHEFVKENPDDLLYQSIEQKTELLMTMIDTDRTIVNKG